MSERPVAPADIRFHGYPLPGVEAMTAASRRSFPRHSHDEFGIGLVDAGGHRSWSDRGQVEAGPGHFISTNPGEVHDGSAIGNGSRSWRILYLGADLLAELCADVAESTPAGSCFTAPVFADAPLRAAFERAFAHARVQDSREPLAAESDLLTLIAGLGRHSTARRPVSGATPDIRRARQRIDADPAARLSLAGLAHEASMSRFQLLRAFARETGLTPHAYILQRRIALARRLLVAGASLPDVALSAGFCDQSHLTRCFVRHLGVTPRRYATRH
jgi:AraC-like DNA-binding protein